MSMNDPETLVNFRLLACLLVVGAGLCLALAWVMYCHRRDARGVVFIGPRT